MHPWPVSKVATAGYQLRICELVAWKKRETSGLALCAAAALSCCWPSSSQQYAAQSRCLGSVAAQPYQGTTKHVIFGAAVSWMSGARPGLNRSWLLVADEKRRGLLKTRYPGVENTCAGVQLLWGSCTQGQTPFQSATVVRPLWCTELLCNYMFASRLMCWQEAAMLEPIQYCSPWLGDCLLLRGSGPLRQPLM
jgi:hypothetical protein